MLEINKKYRQIKNLPMPEFLELCSKGELALSEYKTDIWNYLHKATNHFKLGLVEEIEKNIALREYSIVKKLLNTPEILKKVIKWRKENDEKIPYCEYSELASKLGLPRPKKNSIDIEKLARLIYFKEYKEKGMSALLLFDIGMINLSIVRKILLNSSETTNNNRNRKSQDNKEDGTGMGSSIKDKPQPSESNGHKIEKPTFKAEAIESIWDILKGYFSLDQQAELKRILETGDNARNKLFFKNDGIKLVDAFKTLYNKQIITGCEQTELQQWILQNFSYRHKKKSNDFTESYLNDIISGSGRNCKNKILEIIGKNGQFKIVPTTRIAKHKQYKEKM